MFSNFKDAFIRKPQSTDAPPKVILDLISSDLPTGFFYVHDHDGFCRLEAKDGLCIQSVRIEIPGSAKNVLPANPSLDDLIKYSYNSQTPIKVAADENGCIVINGENIKIEDMIKAPLKNIQLKDSELWMQPEPFPDPFILSLEGDGYNKDIFVRRTPNNSLNTRSFSSIENSVISIRYLITENGSQPAFSFTISINIENAKKVIEVVEAYHIFNAFMDGLGKISGFPLSANETHSENKVSDDTILFWDKLISLEKLLGISFNIEKGITVGEAEIIEALYLSLIEKKPFKTYRVYNSISGKGKPTPISKLDKGQEIFLEFVSRGKVQVLGCDIDIIELKGIFGSTIVIPDDLSYEEEKEYELKLETVNGKKMYDSTQYFISDDELDAVRKNPDHIEQFRLAEEIKTIE